MTDASDKAPPPAPKPQSARKPDEASATAPHPPEEIGGPQGPEPTRFGDWEKAGRCSDF
ncbi:MAG: DUF1674 domain-containing protein [Solirubrobacterales bacterium]